MQEALLDKDSPLLSYGDVQYLYAESGGNTYAEIWTNLPLKRFGDASLASLFDLINS